MDGQDLLRISLLEIYRSIKQHPEPYNTKLRFVELEIIVALYNSKKPEPNLSVAVSVSGSDSASEFPGEPCLSVT